MAWFRRKEQNLKESEKKDIPSGLWEKCSLCNEILYKIELEKRYSLTVMMVKWLILLVLEM